MKSPRCLDDLVWRFQRFAPMSGAIGEPIVIHHSAWRSRVRLCRCIGCILDRTEA